MTKFKIFSFAFGDNSVDAWVPEYWANESVAILQEHMVIGNLVHRDFEAQLAQAGDVVNTRQPGEFTAKRKAVNDDITVQTATATNIQVPLNQHLHTSFLIRDEEQQKSFRDLVAEYLKPAVLSIARAIDKILLYQAPRFLRTDGNTAGSLAADPTISSILDTRQNLETNKAPSDGRNFIVAPRPEAALLKLSDFYNADKVGDQGTALREASLGRKFGFNFYMCQNTCAPSGTVDTVSGEINLAAGYAAGTTTIAVDGISTILVVGQWFTIEGEMTPHRITSVAGTSGPTSITFTPALKSAVADNADVTIYEPATVNEAAGYAAGWAKYIVIDNCTNFPKEGQFIQFTAGGTVYTILEADSGNNRILLDRPLADAIVDNQAIFMGPLGAYNLAFVRNAIALVTRPMALPPQGSGATGAIANFGGLSIRVVWAYDPYKQGMIVTVDTLCGVAILDTDLGELMLTR